MSCARPILWGHLSRVCDISCSCSTEHEIATDNKNKMLNIKDLLDVLILLIYVEMPTIVGILT